MRGQAAEVGSVVVREVDLLVPGLVVAEDELGVGDADLPGQGLHQVVGDAVGERAPELGILLVVAVEDLLAGFEVGQRDREADRAALPPGTGRRS